MCETKTTLRSGTVMPASKSPFRYWFIAMHILTGTKKTFSATEKGKKDKDYKKKRRRRSRKQSTVMVMASTMHDFDTKKKYNKPTKFRCVRMLVIDDLKGKTIEQKVKENISPDSVVKTDN
jgi:hypothetical protein